MNNNKRFVVGLVVVVMAGVLFFALLQGLNMGGPMPTPTPFVPAQGSVTITKQLLDAGKYVEAVAMLEPLVAQDSKNAELQFQLGLGYFNLQRYDEAETAFKTALILDATRAGAVHHNLGALAYQQGLMEQAVQEFQEALKTDPNDPDTHYQLGAAYLIMAVPEGTVTNPQLISLAETEFQKALELAPDRIEPSIGLGTVYRLQNRPQEAVSALEPVVEANPQMSEALFALGQSYAAAGDLARATEMLQRFLDTNPPDVWAEQARALMKQLGTP